MSWASSAHLVPSEGFSNDSLWTHCKCFYSSASVDHSSHVFTGGEVAMYTYVSPLLYSDSSSPTRKRSPATTDTPTMQSCSATKIGCAKVRWLGGVIDR
jgi:hypothetical protein